MVGRTPNLIPPPSVFIILENPNLILMDIKLPGESGLELTKQIKDKFPSTIVIVLTNYDFPEYRVAAYESAADYFLGKGSSTAEEILELVDYILSQPLLSPWEKARPALWWADQRDLA